MGANPTEGPTEGIRPDEEPVCYAGTGRQPLWVRVPPLPPWKRSGWIRSLSRKQVGVARPVGVRVPASALPRWSRGQDTGPSTRRPGFVPRRGTHTCHTNARRRSGAVLGERDGEAESTCQVVERQDVRLLPGRRGFEPLPGSTTLGGRGVQARGCKPRDGGANPSRASIATSTPVVVVQRRGCRYATSVMRVRVPPTTRNNDRSNTDRQGKGASMPTNINDKLISWASEIDERRPSAGTEDRSPPDRRGSRRAHARCPRRHGCDRRFGDPDDRTR